MGSPSEPSSSYWVGKHVVVTGGRGFLGSRLSELARQLGAEVRTPESSDLDLRIPENAFEALDGADVVINLAANVGGIGYNQRNPAPLLRDNVLLAISVLDAAVRARVEKVVTAGSVCAYPNVTPVPFEEANLWEGFPEVTNAPYGIAKRVAHELTAVYRQQYGLDAVMPILANLYGPGDNFDLEDSHVIPALIRKFVEARDKGSDSVPLWGTGTASREFLYVDDAALALLLAAERLESPEPVNIGTSRETTILELAQMISSLTGFSGALAWDPSKPDGQPKRFLSTAKAKELIGFEAQTGLEEGLASTIAYWELISAEHD